MPRGFQLYRRRGKPRRSWAAEWRDTSSPDTPDTEKGRERIREGKKPARDVSSESAPRLMIQGPLGMSQMQAIAARKTPEASDEDCIIVDCQQLVSSILSTETNAAESTRGTKRAAAQDNIETPSKRLGTADATSLGSDPTVALNMPSADNATNASHEGDVGHPYWTRSSLPDSEASIPHDVPNAEASMTGRPEVEEDRQRRPNDAAAVAASDILLQQQQHTGSNSSQTVNPKASQLPPLTGLSMTASTERSPLPLLCLMAPSRSPRQGITPSETSRSIRNAPGVTGNGFRTYVSQNEADDLDLGKYPAARHPRGSNTPYKKGGKKPQIEKKAAVHTSPGAEGTSAAIELRPGGDATEPSTSRVPDNTSTSAEPQAGHVLTTEPSSQGVDPKTIPQGDHRPGEAENGQPLSGTLPSDRNMLPPPPMYRQNSTIDPTKPEHGRHRSRSLTVTGDQFSRAGSALSSGSALTSHTDIRARLSGPFISPATNDDEPMKSQSPPTSGQRLRNHTPNWREAASLGPPSDSSASVQDAPSGSSQGSITVRSTYAHVTADSELRRRQEIQLARAQEDAARFARRLNIMDEIESLVEQLEET